MEHPRVVVCSIRPEIVLPLRLAFSTVGVTCVDVASTDEALMSIAGAEVPPAVIVDECDFDEDAKELADQVRAYDEDVPVLFLGVDGASVDSQAEAFESGGAGYFRLPVDVGKVVAKLSVYLGCALPEIRGATLPGYRLAGNEGVPDPPPHLDDVPVSTEGEPTSLFDLDRSDLDRDSFDDPFEGRTLGSADFSSPTSADPSLDPPTLEPPSLPPPSLPPPSLAPSNPEPPVLDNADVFSSSGDSVPPPPAVTSEAPRPVVREPSDEEEEPQEAKDIRERVARLRRSQAAKSSGSATDYDDNTTQVGAHVTGAARDTGFTGSDFSEDDHDTGDFVSIHSDADPARSSDEGSDFEGRTEVFHQAFQPPGIDEISSALDDVASEDPHSGAKPLAATVFEQDATDAPEHESIDDAVEEAHLGADAYAQRRLDDEGLDDALAEAQASVEEFARLRTQDGPAIDDEKTPESGEAHLHESKDLVGGPSADEGPAFDAEVDRARRQAEDDARQAADRRLEEELRIRAAEDEVERFALEEENRLKREQAGEQREQRLESERVRVEAEAHAEAEIALRARLAEEDAERTQREQEQREALEARRVEDERLETQREQDELERVRAEAEAAAQIEMNTRLEEAQRQLRAEEDAAAAQRREEEQIRHEAEEQRRAQHEAEKARIETEAKARAEQELAERLEEERARRRATEEDEQKRRAEQEQAQQENERQRQLRLEEEKTRIAAETQARTEAELSARIAAEREEAAKQEQAEQQRVDEQQAREQTAYEALVVQERAKVAGEVEAEIRARMESEIEQERALVEEDRRRRERTRTEEAAARKVELELRLEEIRKEAAQRTRADVEARTQSLLEVERRRAEEERARIADEFSAEREREEAQRLAQISEAEKEAERVAREAAEIAGQARIEAEREQMRIDAMARAKLEAETKARDRQRAIDDTRDAKEAAADRARLDVEAKIREEHAAAIRAADVDAERHFDQLREEDDARREVEEEAHAAALLTAHQQTLTKLEQELRAEREARDFARVAREEEYRRRASEETEAMRVAHEASLQKAAEAAALEASERATQEAQTEAARQEEQERREKERVAYRAGLFAGGVAHDIDPATLDDVGSDAWVEGEIAMAAEGGSSYPEAGSAPLAPPDVPLEYVAMAPASGRFGDGELPSVFFSAHFLGVTGALDVRHDDGRERTIFFEEGSPVGVSSNIASDRAEEHLLRAGLITTARYDELRAGPALSARRMCALLVTEGSLRSSELFIAVRGVLTEQVLSVFEWERGAFDFVEERFHPGDRVRLSSPFDHVVAEGIRRKFDEPHLWRVLGGPSTLLGPDDRAPRLPPLGPLEKRAAELFDGQRSIEDVVLESGASSVVALRAALVLISCGAVKVLARGLAHQEDKEEAQERDARTERERILDRLRLARHGDYFAFLGVPEHATSYEVRAAADRIRRRYDVARLQASALLDLRAAVEEIREVCEDAENVLADDELRESYRAHHVN